MRILPMIVMVGAALIAVHAPARAAKPPARPNILFAIADDWGFPHASAYGSTWVKTPAFDRVASGGVLFTRAYTNNAKCAPSRAILLTGRHSWQLEEAANHFAIFPPKFTSVVEALGSNGYFTGFTGKGWGPGTAHNAEGEPREMTGRPFQRRRLQPPLNGIGVIDYAANFGDFLEAAPEGGPWFFWYGSVEPHRGFQYRSGVSHAGKSLSDIDRVPSYWPDNETVRNDMLDYAVEVEHFDTHLNRMLDMLEERGELANTLVIVTSDHGMPFPRCKGQTYEASNHVPLAVMWPEGIRGKGRVVEDFVSFIDVAPTMVAAAGLDWAGIGMAETPGRPWRDIFEKESSGQVITDRDHVLIGKERHDIGRPNDWGYPTRGIVTQTVLYLRNYEPSRWPAGDPVTGYLNADAGPTKTVILNARREKGSDPHWDLCFGKRGPEEFYDLAADPDCVKNLASDPGMQRLKEVVHDKMIAELKAQGDPRMFGKGAVFDNYLYSAEAHRNFYNRFTSGEKIHAGWVDRNDYEKETLD